MKKYQFTWVTQCKGEYASTTSWVDFSLLTLVYQGTIQFSSTGWTQITLQTPFTWDGTSNLIGCNATLDGYSSNNVVLYFKHYRLYFIEGTQRRI